MHAEDFVLCRQMIALNAAMELTHRQMAAFFAAEIDDSEDAALEEAELWDDEEEKSDSEVEMEEEMRDEEEMLAVQQEFLARGACSPGQACSARATSSAVTCTSPSSPLECDSSSRKTPGRAAGRVIVILSTSL